MAQPWSNPQILKNFGRTCWHRPPQIPLNATLTPVPLRSTPEVEVFEVHYDSLDHVRVAGLVLLATAFDRNLYRRLSFTLVIFTPTLPKGHAALGYATFGAAPRGKLRSNAHYNPGYPMPHPQYH